MWSWFESATPDQRIQLAIAVGTNLAAFATLAAVLYSLTQTRRATQTKLKIIAAVVDQKTQFARMTGSADRADVFRVQVVNHGARTVTLGVVGWKFGPWWKREWTVQNFSEGDTLPASLQPTDYATFVIGSPIDSVAPKLRALITEGRSTKRPYLRVLVQTSLGEKFTQKLRRADYKRIVGP